MHTLEAVLVKGVCLLYSSEDRLGYDTPAFSIRLLLRGGHLMMLKVAQCNSISSDDELLIILFHYIVVLNEPSQRV